MPCKVPLSSVPAISKRLIKGMGAAIGDFDLISENDRIMVGLSGGKDSTLLLLALKELLRKSPVKFELEACTVDMTNGKMDVSVLEDMCRSMDIPYHVKCHPIEDIIALRRERSPCSFCANIRRGILCGIASERGCNSLALGHNLDDVAETVLINLFHTGSFRCFMPKLWQSRTEVWVIRPLVYLQEQWITSERERLGLPIIKNPCSYAGNTERDKTKKLISSLSEQVPDIRNKILRSLTRLDEKDKWIKKDWKTWKNR